MNTFKFLFFLILVLCITALSCSQNSDQRDFEQQAYAIAKNITETEDGVEIISKDEDDWRISPLFQGIIRIERFPHPNPALTSMDINFPIVLNGVQQLDVIRLYSRDEFGEFGVPIAEETNLPMNGIIEFTVSPLELASANNAQEAKGLHRVIIVNGSNQVISYGDIRIE